MKNNVQKFGKFLSGMVMPNIGALIAFGFLAAFFIDTGWFPNEGFNSIVGPILSYLIPILIAFTGGKMVAGERGGVCGAIAVMGAIMSNPDITMLMAAMVMGTKVPCVLTSRGDTALTKKYSIALACLAAR